MFRNCLKCKGQFRVLKEHVFWCESCLNKCFPELKRGRNKVDPPPLDVMVVKKAKEDERININSIAIQVLEDKVAYLEGLVRYLEDSVEELENPPFKDF